MLASQKNPFRNPPIARSSDEYKALPKAICQRHTRPSSAVSNQCTGPRDLEQAIEER